jgi:hypothetical protein
MVRDREDIVADCKPRASATFIIMLTGIPVSDNIVSGPEMYFGKITEIYIRSDSGKKSGRIGLEFKSKFQNFTLA